MIQAKGLVLNKEDGWQILASHLKEIQYSKIFILVDEITEALCLPVLYSKLDLKPCEILKINSGEKNKNISTSIYLWEKLSEKRADRNCLIINLGGGMITDLGGFVATTYKRGVAYVNIPTTLLGMVDASIGGKNGIDLGLAKNQVGTISNAEMVIVDNDFLLTLPEPQLISGMAEMIKHSLISSRDSWERIQAIKISDPASFGNLIWESIEIKKQTVSLDPLETGVRKTLNFGHTLGHAIESHFMMESHKPALLHGEAIAIGMILASYFSNELLGLPAGDLERISSFIKSQYPSPDFSPEDIQKIIELLVHDKKNRGGKVLFVLLEDIGIPKVDCIVNNTLIYKGFNYYKYL